MKHRKNDPKIYEDLKKLGKRKTYILPLKDWKITQHPGQALCVRIPYRKFHTRLVGNSYHIIRLS